MGIQTDSIDVTSSLMLAGSEVLNASGDVTTNLIQGADDGTGIIVGHAPVGASTGSALQLVSLTTTERDNLVGTDGMMIWNETTGQIEGYDAGWAAVGGGSGVTDLQGAYEGGNTIVTDSGNGAFDVSGTEAISLDAQAASNFTVTGSGLDLTLSVAGGGAQSLILSSAGIGTDAIDINATGGGIDIDASGVVNIQSNQAGGGVITMTTPNGGVTLNANAANSSGVISLTSAGTGTNAVDINCSSGGFDLDAGTGGVDIFSTGGFSIDASNTTASNLTSANTTASTNTTLTIACNNTGATAGDSTLDIDANSANGTATVSIGITNADAVSISRTGVATTVNGTLTVTQAADFDAGLTVAAGQSITGDGALTVVATSAVLSLDGSGLETSATTFTADAALTISTGTGDDNLSLTSGNNGAGDSGDVLVDAGTATGTTGVVTLAGTNASALNLGRTGLTASVPGALAVTQTSTFTGVADFDAGMTIAAGQAITGDGALSVLTTGATALTVDAGGAAAVNIANTNATTLNLGNTSSALLEQFVGYQRVTGIVALTDNTATTVLTIALASSEATTGQLRGIIFSTDNTDFQAEYVLVRWAAVNKGGVYTTDVVTSFSPEAPSAGTLTSSAAITTGTDLINIQITADTSLTPTTLECRFVAEEYGSQTLTVA